MKIWCMAWAMIGNMTWMGGHIMHEKSLDIDESM